jgi:hypothetical protein
MVRRVAWLLTLALTAVLVLSSVGPAAALPPSPWTGNWLRDAAESPAPPNQLFTLTQSGSSVTGSYSHCGGGTLTGTVSPDGATLTASFRNPPGVPNCSGDGTATATVTMSPDGQSFRGSGVTGFGTGFSFTARYQGGGSEPRSTSSRPICPGGRYAGLWLSPAGNTFSFVQNGSALFARGVTFPQTMSGTVSGGTARGTYTIPEGSGTFTFTLAPDLRTFAFTGTTPRGTPEGPFPWTFQGCDPDAVADPRGADLERVIPNPQVVRAGPTTIVAPGTISIASLVRSKCVLVRVASRRPARALVSIFSGRRSIRLFGQRLVVFRAPGAKQVCIRVPFRARTFNVRTPLAVALGYAAGATARPGQRRTRPTIKPIRLVP